MKSQKELISALILITTLVMTGCSKENGQEIYLPEPVIMTDAPEESIAFVEESVESSIELEVMGSEINIEEELYNSLYDENIDSILVINTYLNEFENKKDLENDYLRAVYMLMYNSQVSMKSYLKELSLMSLYQRIPMCLPEDLWNESFKNLIELYPCTSLFDTYGPFAKYVHELQCEYEHTINEYGAYDCYRLEQDYTRNLEK